MTFWLLENTSQSGRQQGLQPPVEVAVAVLVVIVNSLLIREYLTKNMIKEKKIVVSFRNLYLHQTFEPTFEIRSLKLLATLNFSLIH